MWINQLIQTIKARRKLALWLKRQRAVRLELAHLSDHLKKDIGLNTIQTNHSPHWQQAQPGNLARSNATGTLVSRFWLSKSLPKWSFLKSWNSWNS